MRVMASSAVGSICRALGLRLTIAHDPEAYEIVRHQYVRRDRPQTVAATRGYAGPAQTERSRVGTREADCRPAEDLRAAYKRADAAVRAVAAAAVGAARAEVRFPASKTQGAEMTERSEPPDSRRLAGCCRFFTFTHRLCRH